MQRPRLHPAIVAAGVAFAALARAQAPDALVGRWEGTIKTTQGERPGVLLLQKDAAGAYSGTITGLRGDLALRDIKLAGDTLTAEAVVESPQGSVKTKYSFVLQGGELRGKSETDFAGQVFSAVYELKRGGTGAAQPSASPSPQRLTGRGSPPQPTQKQSLDYFAGRWSFRWTGRESAVSPGGIVEGRLVLKPSGDGDFLEGQLEAPAKTSPFGDKLTLGFVDSNKTLVLLEQRAKGIQTLSVGDWTSPIAIRFKVAPFQAGARKLRLNRTLSIVAAHSFTLTEELSEDGGPFVRLGNAVFSRPAETTDTPGKN